MDYIITNIDTGESELVNATPETIGDIADEISRDTGYHLELFHYEEADKQPELYAELKKENNKISQSNIMMEEGI